MPQRKKLPLIVLCVVVVAAGVWWFNRPTSFSAAGRDLVLITCDTTRFDHFGCYGYERNTTPNIDRLAESGVRFEVAYAATPITLPSHCTIFTGQDPIRHGVRNNATYSLAPERTTLAELLQGAGWETGAFVSAFVLGDEFGLAQGFDHYDDNLASGFRQSQFTIQRRRAGATVDRALAWMKGRDGTRPVFLWVHFFDPHRPYTYDPELMKQFGQEQVDLYDGEIFYMDREIGRLRSEIEALGRNPVWVVTTDHGEGLDQPHGEVVEPAHGIFLYDEILRSPLIFSGQGVFPSGVVASTTARQADILPTLLELVKLPIPGDLDGESLLGRFDAESRPVYLESLLPYEDYAWCPQFALVEGGYKYVESKIPELYHLTEDPGETRNLARSKPQMVDVMAGKLEELRRRQAGEATRFSTDGIDAEALRSIGYASGSGLVQEGEPLPDPKPLMTRTFNVQRKLDEARFMIQKRPAAAFALLEEIVEKSPGNGEALKLLGWEPLRIVVQLPPDHAQREALLAHSVKAFRILRDRAPALPDGEFGLAKVNQLTGDVDGALRSYLAIADKHPRYVPVLDNALQIYYGKKDIENAIAVADRILAIDATNFVARYTKGRCLLDRSQPREALDIFRGILGERPGDPAVLFFLGESYRGLGDHRQALQAYQQIRNPQLRQMQNVDALEAECRKQLGGG